MKQILPKTHPPFSMKLSTFRWLLRFAILCFTLIWAIDHFSGLISPFDKVSYPVCICFFILIDLISCNKKLSLEHMYLFTYIIVAGYLTSSSIYHHIALNGIFSNASQWLGLNYVMAYLFLDVRKAALTSILVFILTFIGHFVVLIVQFPLKNTLGVLFNISLAHLVYMVLLWTVLRMRVQSAKIQERLEMLEHYALLDPLTQVLNRRGLEDVIRQTEQDFRQHGWEYAILLIDIDNFKQINDRHGHLVGDWVLTECIAMLNKMTGPEDQLGRWGGEEFVVLIRNHSRQDVLLYAEKMREAVHSRLQVDDGEMLSVSIGIGYSDEAHTSREVFDIADQNLYKAKNAGRNRVMDTRLSEAVAVS